MFQTTNQFWLIQLIQLMPGWTPIIGNLAGFWPKIMGLKVAVLILDLLVKLEIHASNIISVDDLPQKTGPL